MAVKARASITLTRVDDGKGIKSTSISYQASTSGTTAPTGSWSPNVPSVPQGQYLWSRSVYTYTDNTTSTSYSVAYIPKNGQNGAQGSAGTGVAGIVPQYYLSTSKTAQIGGSWVTAMPVWSSGKYLWTRYQINYKNPTSTSYTSPICDSSWEAVNEIQVGGRNYTLKTAKSSTVIGNNTENQCPAIYDMSVNWQYFKGKTVSISFDYEFSNDAKVTDPARTITGSIGMNVTPWSRFARIPLPSAGLKGHVEAHERISEAVGSDTKIGSRFDSFVGSVTISNFKLEIGNKATDWSPAPEDIENELHDGYYTKVQTDAKIKAEGNRITLTVETVKQTADSANQFVNNAKNNYGYQYKSTITINGDANKYYPLVLRGGNQDISREILVTRSYNHLAPPEWNGHPTVKGIALNLKIKCNYGGWGGANYSWCIHDLEETYGNVFAGADWCMAYMGFAIFLRGGGTTGAMYHVYSDQPIEVDFMNGHSPKVWYNGATDLIGSNTDGSYKWYAPEPRTYTQAVIDEIASKKYIDVATDAKNIADDGKKIADEALSKANTNDGRITQSISQIEILDKQISSLVVDENGTSLMEQKGDGWYFNMGAIQNKVNNTVDTLSNLSGDVQEAEALLNTTKNMADALETKTAFINMITLSDGRPAILLGQPNSDFKLRITNTSIDFLDGKEAVAYITNQTLYITRAIIKDEIQIGDGTGWILKRRANGNLGLRWNG